MDEITLTAPAKGSSVPVLRSLIASAAAHLDIPYDEIDDLRLAIDEAAAHLIGLDPAGSILSVRLLFDEDRFEVLTSIDTLPEPWPPEGLDETLTWQILSGLTDEAGFDQADGQAQIRFVKLIERVNA